VSLIQSECNRVSGQLWEFASGTLPPSERQSIAEHIRDCAACKSGAETYAALVRGVGAERTAAVPLSETNWQQLASTIAQAERKQRAVRRGWRVAMRYVTAASALGFVAVFSMYRHFQPPATVERVAVQDRPQLTYSARQVPGAKSPATIARPRLRVAGNSVAAPSEPPRVRAAQRPRRHAPVRVAAAIAIQPRPTSSQVVLVESADAAPSERKQHNETAQTEYVLSTSPDTTGSEYVIGSVDAQQPATADVAQLEDEAW